MNDITYVGLDVHKATVCVAIAESGRGGELREVGVFENRPDVLRKMVLDCKHRRRLDFCYEAGPCGYGLHRLLTILGHECVVTPIWIPDAAHEAMRETETSRSPRGYRLESTGPVVRAISAPRCHR